MKNKYIFTTIAGILLLNSCSTSTPKEFTERAETAHIYPDYCDVTIPNNIAPLNFRIDEYADKAIIKVTGTNNDSIVVSCDNQNEVNFPHAKWKRLLKNNIGGNIKYDIYLKKGAVWEHCKPYVQHIDKDSIDAYLTYRLIEPSYQESGHMGIYQYNLEQGEETAIFTNHHDRISAGDANQRCVNCHTAQRNHPENKMFYYRSPKGGLMLTYNGELKKINTRCGDMFAGTVYPAWHPTKPFIAFSSNRIKQSFSSYDKSKIDPFDMYSDLVLYDIEKNEISAIRKTRRQQETNPCWSADGNYLYFNCSDSIFGELDNPREMLYNIHRIKFNGKDSAWGANEVIYEPAKKGRSATYPKASPDGKYLLITEADWGTSTQTNKSADLYLIDLSNNQVRPLTEINCPTESDSYHDWSSNSHWIVFCSRREDGNYARPYFSHIDENGRASKPFVLPRENSRYHANLIKSYNVTEFSSQPVTKSINEIQQTIDTEIINATYNGPIDPHAADAYSGASVVRK